MWGEWKHKMRIDLVIGVALLGLVGYLLGPWLLTVYSLGFLIDLIRWLPGCIRGYVLIGVPALLFLMGWGLVSKLLGGVDDFFSSMGRRGSSPKASVIPDLADAPRAPVALATGSYIPGAGAVAPTEMDSGVAELREAAGARLAVLMFRAGVDVKSREGKELVGYARDFMDHDGVLGAVVFEGVDGTSEFDDVRMPKLGMLTTLAAGAYELYRESVPPILILRAARTGKSVIDGRPNKFWHRDMLASWKGAPW